MKNLNKIPDPRKHAIASFIKSTIRLLGYGALWWSIDFFNLELYYSVILLFMDLQKTITIYNLFDSYSLSLGYSGDSFVVYHLHLEHSTGSSQS